MRRGHIVSEIAVDRRLHQQVVEGNRVIVRYRGSTDERVRRIQPRPALRIRTRADAWIDDEARCYASTELADDRQAIGARQACLLYTSDAADERSSVDLGGRRIIKKK